MSSPPPSHVGEASTSRQRSRNGNNGNGNNGNGSGSSRSRRQRRRRPQTPTPSPQVVVITSQEASTSTYYNLNGGVWPEPFVESLALQLALDTSLSHGRLAVAPTLAILFQVFRFPFPFILLHVYVMYPFVVLIYILSPFLFNLRSLRINSYNIVSAQFSRL